MKSLEELKIHELEKSALVSITGGLVKAGSSGSWSWGPGTYTHDGIITLLQDLTTLDYTGTISYDGIKLQGISVKGDDGTEDYLINYAREENN